MDGAATGIVGGGSVTGLGSLERWWNDPGIAAWSIVLFGCFLLNVTLLFAFLARPGLRTISNRFVMNLTASNLLTCALLNPLLMMDGPPAAGATLATTSSSASASAGSNVCAVSEGATALVTTSSVLSVLLIAVDQYFAVVDPLRYRARIDKLRSAVLIVSVWLISAAFGLTASLNPRPRSLWLSCTTPKNGTLLRDVVVNATAEVSIDSTFAFLRNGTSGGMEEDEVVKEEVRQDVVVDYEGVAATPASLRTFESIEIDGGVGLLENSSGFYRAHANDSALTYGLIYAIVHSVFAYLLPFAGVCWIYVSIYSAAHRNSERTRRTGSRSILASASFCEDPYGCTAKSQQQQQQHHHHHDQQQQQQQQSSIVADAFAAGEFRRIPKISSLSSIDETSETAHSAANQASRRRSFSSSSDAAAASPCDDRGSSSSGVVFTVGLRPVEISAASRGPKDRGNDETAERDPATPASLRATTHLLVEEDRGATSCCYELVDDAEMERRRASSRDLAYDAALPARPESSGWIAGGSSDSESEDERGRYGRYDSLEVPGGVRGLASTARRSAEYFLSGDETRCDAGNSSAGTRNLIERPRTATTAARRADDEENSVALKESEYSRVNSSFPSPAEAAVNPENKRPRRFGRRPSRSGIESHACFGRNAQEHNGVVENNGSSTACNGHGNAAETTSCLLTPIVTITPAAAAAAPSKPGGLTRVPSVRSTSGYINSIKHRISNGSLFRYREEARAARISALVIVMGLICWSPYVLLSVIKNLPRYSYHEFPHEYDVLALGFLTLAAYVSPLLFGYRSRRVKRELRRFFCFRRELSYKNNRSLMAKKVLKRRHSGGTLSHLEMDHRYNILSCVYGRGRWPREKVQFVQVPDTALAVETCRSSFSSGASTQISSTSTEEC